jgi:hypothetical protein
MADREAQKPGAIKPSTLLRTRGGKDNPVVGLADKLMAVETQAVKDYGVYNSDDYSGWRKKNGFGSVNATSVAKEASNLRSSLKSKSVSMADIKAANAFLKKYHSPLVGLDKREAKMFNEDMAKAKRKMPFHRQSSLIRAAGDSARARRKAEDN